MSLFDTERLFGRRLTIHDVDAMFAVYGDPETVRFVGDSEPLTREGCLQWIEITDKNFQNRGYGMIAFCDGATGDIVGCGGIVHPNQQEQPEVKYAFRRNHWGKGYATEAVGGLVRFARKSLGIRTIMATVAPGNQPSQHVLSKLGFSHIRDHINEDASITQVWIAEA